MNTISPGDLKKAAQEIPPSPRVFGRLGKLLKDPNTELEDITELVNADSSLTAHVIRLSNSAMYTIGMTIDNLEDAVNRIGFGELFKLVGMAAASQVLANHNRTYDILGADLWENSLACGIGMEILARKTGIDDQEAYTVGLLRNMGKLVIDHCAKNDRRFPSYQRSSNLPLLDWEENNFGITNPTVAGFILSSWNFAEEISLAIQHQYEPANAPGSVPLINLLNLANSLAERIGKGIHGESSYWTETKPRLEAIGLDIGELEETQEQVAEILEKIVASFG